MHEPDRSLYIENPKRPYSWTGELDSYTPPSPKPQNGSLKTNTNSLNERRPQDVQNLYIEPHKRGKGGPVPTCGSNGTKRSRFNLPRSGSPKLLMDKLPFYLRWESDIPAKNENHPLPTNAPDPIPIDRKRSKKFPKLQRRKGSPSIMTSQDDFEYFSLSQPPPGLTRPVEIFPPPQVETKIRSDQHQKHAPITKGDKCRDCMSRLPYATLIATLLCIFGVGVFCGTMYRGTTLTLLMFDEVFRIKITWDREFRVEPVKLTFMIVGAAMGGLGLMILFLGCLSTGSTRSKVYRTWRGRVGGRVSCAIFMGITYLLSIIWLMMFSALIIVTIFYTLAWFQCRYIPENQCIDYNQFEFLFPSSSTEEDRRVCREEKKTFCKDCVNNAEVMFILATVSAFLVIMSLIHYLMCLAANYAHIKDQEKFIDLQEIQYLQESEMSTLPKDRF